MKWLKFIAEIINDIIPLTNTAWKIIKKIIKKFKGE